jgi:hypothetical protein
VNPFLSKELAGEHIRDLHEAAARNIPTASSKHDRIATVRVRRFAERDIDGIRRLAALDEKPVPTGGVLVAELAGELVAALPVDGGEAIADPFKPTKDIVELLRMRASQINKTGTSRKTPRARWPRLQIPRRKLA